MVYIIGAGEQGRIVLDYFKLQGTSVEGFIDDNATGTVEDTPVLGGLEALAEKSRQGPVLVHVAVGNAWTRKKIVARINFPVTYVNLVHPSALVSQTAYVPPDAGIFIGPGVVINTNARLGQFCLLNTGVIVEHDVVLGDYATINPGAIIAGAVKIGALSTVGIGAMVLDHYAIGNGSVVGAGAVVTKNFGDFVKLIGVPARVREQLEERPLQ